MCGPSETADNKLKVKIQYDIVLYLTSKGVPRVSAVSFTSSGEANMWQDWCFGPKGRIMEEEIMLICREKHVHWCKKKNYIERALRLLILDHREKFPELKDTELVKEWERVTGLRWL